MDQLSIKHALADLPFSAIRYFPIIDSTNDEAARWADQGAPDMAIVIADEQTAGRGRAGRRWYTPPNSALAFSLVLYPQVSEENAVQHLTAMGALAVQTALEEGYNLPTQIKWPNDILIDRHKVAGILTEAHWMGNQLNHIILGIGINIAPSSITWASDEAINMNVPVTCLQNAADKVVDSLDVLHKVLKALLVWRSHLNTAYLIKAWESRLAFRDEWVIIYQENLYNPDVRNAGMSSAIKGQILGLSENGGLRLRSPEGGILTISSGEVQVRPVIEQKLDNYDSTITSDI